MFRQIALLSLVLGSSIAAATAFGAEDPIIAPNAPNLSVDLPRSTAIDQSATYDSAERLPPSALEFGVSSWSPKSLELATQFGTGESFKPRNVPELSINLIKPVLGTSRIGVLSIRAGLSAFTLTRTGTISYSGIAQQETQDLTLIPFRAGVELEPAIGSTSFAAPYLQAALLPTLAITPRSPMSDERALFGLPYELGMGYAFKLNLLGVLSQLNAGGVMTTGSFKGESFYGLGVGAGLRVRL